MLVGPTGQKLIDLVTIQVAQNVLQEPVVETHVILFVLFLEVRLEGQNLI